MSYAHSDRAVVLAELRRLRSMGVRVWYDDGIDPGSEWPQEVGVALTGAAACLVMVSPASVARKNVRDEVGFALDHGKPIVVVHLAPTELPSGLRLRLGQVQAILRWQLDEQSYGRQLGRALGPYAGAGAGGLAAGRAGPAGLIGVAAAMPGGQAVVGEIPRQPPGWIARRMLTQLEEAAGSGIAAACAVTGLRGVGKTQLAAAYARDRVRDGWPLVAWSGAESREILLAGLARVAARLGVADPEGDSAESARRLREHLEGWAGPGLLVLDNALDPDALRPFLPAAGGMQVVVTTTERAMAELGRVVDVTEFTRRESLEYLADRTGLADEAGAGAVAQELGDLPLGLAQAAAVIRGQHLTYQQYLGRLRRVPVSSLLSRVPGGDYALPLASALLLAVQAIEADSPGELAGTLLRVVAVLSSDGVSRDMLAGLTDGNQAIGDAEIDDAIGRCAAGSLLSWSVTGDQVIMHRLAARVLRERDQAAGQLTRTIALAAGLLKAAQFGEEQAWARREDGLDLAEHAEATWDAATTGGITDPDLLASLLTARAWAVRQLRAVANLDRAIELGIRTLADSQRGLGPDAPYTLTAQHDLAQVYLETGRLSEAIPLFEDAVARRRRILGASHPESLESQDCLAIAYSEAGRSGQAILLHEQTLADRLRVLGAEHPGTLDSRHNLAFVYKEAGRLREAIALLERNLTDTERVLGADHPDTFISEQILARAYEAAGRIATATALLEKSQAACARALGPDHPYTLGAQGHLAECYDSAGRTEEAMSLLEKTLPDSERVMGIDHPDTLMMRRHLAHANESAGCADKAAALYEQNLADSLRVFGADHPRTLSEYDGLAHAYESAGRLDQAAELFELNLAKRRQILGAEHPETLTSQHNLAHLYQTTGRNAEAIALYEQVLISRQHILGLDHPATRSSQQELDRARSSTRPAQPADAGHTPDALKEHGPL